MAKNSQKPVCVHFANPEITALFSELLEGRGIRTLQVTKITEIPFSLPLVTEPLILEKLGKAKERTCLLVGDRDSLKGYDNLSIEQPLTLPKIERCIQSFIDQLL